jgi:tRNA(Ile)-lysidine synthase
MDAARPVSDEAFARALAAAGPFEATPQLAVAVSGGADSLALALLADRWARARGGCVTALTVDHGLRPESGSEARRVGAWLAAHGIAHHILPWQEAKPATGIQEHARAARYRLLGQWCRAHGVLHLLLGHHRDDQAETFLMRLQRGSRFDGLAAMPLVAETRDGRLIRPLLGVAKADLVATLNVIGQDWIEDPTNRDLAFARSRLRALMPTLERAGLDADALAATAARYGRARAALEESTARLLAQCAALHPAGYARMDRARLLAAPAEIGVRALARALVVIGGRVYPPRAEPLERLYAGLGAGGNAVRTLAGCRIEGRGDEVLVCRELRRPPARVLVAPATRLFWDGRFVIALGARAPAAGPAFVGPLGDEGWAAVVKDRPEVRATALPWPARLALPALWSADQVIEVPHLGYRRDGGGAPAAAIEAIVFRPRQALSGVGFFVS